MESEIQTLGASTISLIKSTQVISSVYSAVKELAENALDAGTSLLAVRLEDFGLQRIEVKDNGCGVTESDLAVMCKPHTTSKISSFADLECLQSFGFRGEALSSLCEVGLVSITSKHRTAKHGHCCHFTASGELRQKKVAACNVGTMVEVKKLFHSLPVRKQVHSNNKLKKEQLKKVEELLMAYSLALPSLHITLHNDKVAVFQRSPVKDVAQALHCVFPDCARLLVHKSTDRDNISVSLHILSGADYQFSRSSPSHLFILANKRPVMDKSLTKSMKAHFSPQGCHGKYPVGLLRVTVQPSALDVNLEPNKDRILFKEQETVNSILQELLAEIYGPLPSSEDLEDDIVCTLARQQTEDKSFLCAESEQTILENGDETRKFSNNGDDKKDDIFPQDCFTRQDVTALKKIALAKQNFSEKVKSKSGTSSAGSLNDKNDEFFPQDCFTRQDVTALKKTALSEKVFSEKVKSKSGTTSAGSDVVSSTPLPEDNRTLLFGSLSTIDPITEDEQVLIDSILSQTEQNYENDEKLNGNSNLIDKNLTVKDPSCNNHNNQSPQSVSHGNNQSPQSVSQSPQSVSQSPQSVSHSNNQSPQSVSHKNIPCLGDKHLSRPPGTHGDKDPLTPCEDKNSLPSKSKSDTIMESDSITAEEKSSKNIDVHCEKNFSGSDLPSIDPMAWSRGQVVAKDGCNIQSVVVGPPYRVPSVDNSLESPCKKRRLDPSDEGYLISASSTLPSNSKPTSLDNPDIAIVSEKLRETGDHFVSKKNPVFGSNSPSVLLKAPPLKAVKKETSGDRNARKTVLCSPGIDKKHGAIVRKPTSAFAMFARDIRNDVMREFPGAEFTVIGREIAARWKALEAAPRQRYEDLALRDMDRYKQEIRESRRHSVDLNNSTLDSFVIGKATSLEPQVTLEAKPSISISLQTEVVRKKIRQSQSYLRKPSPPTKVLGKLLNRGGGASPPSVLSFVLLRGRGLYGLRPHALRETLLFCNLIQTLCVPRKALHCPMPFNKSSLGLEKWSTLVSLPREAVEGGRYLSVTDTRITHNGLAIAMYSGTDGSVSHGEVMEVADSVAFYGIKDMEEILSVIGANCDASLADCRPVKLRHWLQGECVRMTRAAPNIFSVDQVKEKLFSWENFCRKYKDKSFVNPSLCLHGKEILHQLYDLDSLPASQQSTLEETVED